MCVCVCVCVNAKTSPFYHDIPTIALDRLKAHDRVSQGRSSGYLV